MLRLILPAVSAMILGIVAAFIYLAIQPVPQLTAGQMQTMQPLPKVYFFRGIEAPSADYGRLRRELPNAQTGRFSVSEGDLNTWLRSELLPSMSRADSAISPVTFWGFTATQPNFRVTGDTVIFSVVWQGKDQKGGDPRKIIHQIHWSVDEDGEHWHISGGYIGQFPVKALPGLTRMLWHRFKTNWWQAFPEKNFGNQFKAMEDIRLENGRIHFSID